MSYVSRSNLQIGMQIAEDAPLIAVVAGYHIWVNINFKETQMNNIHIGLSRRVKIDTGDLDGYVLSTIVHEKPRYQSNALALDLVLVN